MKPARRVLEDVLVPAVIVAPKPATVTQRSCFEHFGLSKADYLRLAGTAFPVKLDGQLRVAKYADVEAYLTTGATYRKGDDEARAKPVTPAPAPELDVDGVDVHALLRKAGFRNS